ncbi:MAG: FAD-dependent oxidoreductase [Gammaproteobacteria bacterium]|nr:FAD-dependent oxidoreductase [Gammaproteobacteria bacterium]
MSECVPAVVVGAGINGLGVARSLARENVPVWIVDSDSHQPGMHTRAARPLAVPALQAEALVEGLRTLSSTVFGDSRPVLLLTQEESVKAVSRYRHALSPHYRFTLPDPTVVESLLHKQGFQRTAERLGAPIPPLVHLRSVPDLHRLEAIRFPVVIKPGERHPGYSRSFAKAYRIERCEQAERLIRRILPVMADVVVQEWIEGPDSNIYFCLQHIGKDGSLTASFTGRKIRSWPPQVGGTASCTAAPGETQELAAMSLRFFREAGVAGLAGMEYKLDARSGDFRMVEPTIGRTDYQEEVATLNGVNLPYAAYCAELGVPGFQSAPTKQPVVWRDRSADAQSAAAQNQSIRQGFPRGSVVTEALWRWHDPMPFLLHMTGRLGRALHLRTARMLKVSKNAKGES